MSMASSLRQRTPDRSNRPVVTSMGRALTSPAATRSRASAPPSPAVAVSSGSGYSNGALGGSDSTESRATGDAERNPSSSLMGEMAPDQAVVTSGATSSQVHTTPGTAASGLSEPHMNHPMATSNVFEHLKRSSRRAATSSPLPPEVLCSAVSRREMSDIPPSRPSLSTEILPAPPKLPQDPTYPPLDPTAPQLPPGTLAQQASGQTNGGTHALVTQDKKRKQPTYSLSKPDNYDGKVPYALYAIVHDLPETGAKDKGTRRKKSRAGKDSVNGRVTRVLAPSDPIGPAANEAAVPDILADSSRLSSEAPSDAQSTPHLAEIALPSLGEGEPKPAGVSAQTGPAEMLSTNGSIAEETQELIPAHAQIPESLSSIGVSPSSPSSSVLATSRSGAAADAIDSNSGARDLCGLPSDSSQQISSTPKKTSQNPKTARKIRLKGALTGVAPPAQKEAAHPAASLQSIEAPLPESSSSSPTPASPMPSVEGAPILSLELPADPSSSGLRPTRAAAAKVAARGSYYDPESYALQAPAQAAATNGIAGPNGIGTPPPGARKGRKSGPSAARLSAGQTASPTPDAKGKGKEKVDGPTGVLTGGSAAPGVAAPPNGALDDNAPANDEYCSTCFGTGHFICCDSCPRSFHFACVNPPLHINEVPLDEDEAWHCRSCSSLRNPPRKPTKADGILGPLIAVADASNPSIFSLPPEVKNSFKNVATDPDGSYQDSGRVRQIKADKKGVIEERDPFRLRDAKGKEVLCYRCGESSLPRAASLRQAERDLRDEKAKLKAKKTEVPNGKPSTNSESLVAPKEEEQIHETTGWRRIISCDFCSLHWHLDCLDPPLSGMPSNFRRWKCPCHIEDLLARTRTPKAASQVQIIDLPVPTIRNTGLSPGQFYRPRVVNSGQIDIIADPMDTYWSASTSTDTSGRSLQRGWTNMEIPQADALIPGGGMRKVRFRLPEKVVRTDWWMKVLSGGADRLVDVDAADKTEAAARSSLDCLAAVASDELASQVAAQVGRGGSVQQLVKLALNSLQPPSVRLQPLGEFEAPSDPPISGHLPDGGVLKKEENQELPESSLRESLSTLTKEDLDINDATLQVPRASVRMKRGRSGASSSESDLTDIEDDDMSDAATAPGNTAKKPKIIHEGLNLGSDEIQSLMAIRELMQRKGEKELLDFLRS